MNDPLMKKILCIDDDENVLSALKRIFHRCPYNIITARDGEDGIFKVVSENPDLIFLDVKMPKVDGFEFLAFLKDKELNHIPVVMLSGEKSIEDIFKGYEEGSVYYLTKPTKSEYVLNIVEYLLEDISDERRLEIESKM